MTAPTGRVTQARPLASIIKDLDRRLTRLERHNPVSSTSIIQLLGVSSGPVVNQNFASTSFAVVTGTTISVAVTAPSNYLRIQAFLTGKVSAGTNNGLWQIAVSGPNGYTNSTGAIYVGQQNYITLYSYLLLAQGLPPGTYTAQLQAAVDVGGTTFNVPGNSTVCWIEQLGA